MCSTEHVRQNVTDCDPELLAFGERQLHLRVGPDGTQHPALERGLACPRAHHRHRLFTGIPVNPILIYMRGTVWLLGAEKSAGTGQKWRG
jgi:hypothetical protein